MNTQGSSTVDVITTAKHRMGAAPNALRLLELVLAGLMLSATVAAQNPAPQVRPPPLPKEGIVQDNTCPAPMSQKIEAGTRDRIETADMPSQWQQGNGLNGTKINTWYGHTIRWNTRGRCCQVTRAVLTVKFKALKNGSPNGTDAFNDNVHVVKNGLYGPNLPGGGVLGGGRIWQPPVQAFQAGATTSKTITITNPAILASGRVSFFAQDDTAIQGATLTITGCCLDARQQVGDQTPQN